MNLIPPSRVRLRLAKIFSDDIKEIRSGEKL